MPRNKQNLIKLKFIIIALACFSVVLVQSCVNIELSPSESAKAYFEQLREGNLRGFVDDILLADDYTEEQYAMTVALIEEIQQESKRKFGEIISIQASSNHEIVDNSKANVTVVVHYQNGHDKKLTFDMVKKEEKWKMVLMK